MKITFRQAQDVRNLANQLIDKGLAKVDASKKRPRLIADPVQLATQFIMDTQGITYFVPEILALSEDEAKESSICFKTNDNENLLTLHDIWRRKCQGIQFIYNRPLADALVTINLKKSRPLDPTFPTCALFPTFPLTDPAITSHLKNYNFHEIKGWLSRAKEKHNPLVYPGTEIPLTKQDILKNYALRQLIHIHLRELMKYYEGLSKRQPGHPKLRQIQEKIESYKASLTLQDRYWQKKEEDFYKKWDNKEIFSLNLSELNKCKKYISERIDHYQTKNTSIDSKAGGAIAVLGVGAIVVGGILMCAALFMPVLGVGIAALGAIIVGCGFSSAILNALLLKKEQYKKIEHDYNTLRKLSSHKLIIERHIQRHASPEKRSVTEKQTSLTNKCEQIKKQIDAIDNFKQTQQKPALVVPATSFFGKIGSSLWQACSFNAPKPEERQSLLQQDGARSIRYT